MVLVVDCCSVSFIIHSAPSRWSGGTRSDGAAAEEEEEEEEPPLPPLPPPPSCLLPGFIKNLPL